MNTDTITNLILTVYSIGCTAVSIPLYFAYKRYKNENLKLKESLAKSPKKRAIDFEKDIKCLEISMENNVMYFVNTLLTPLLAKQDGGFLKDSDIEEIITTIVVNVISELSDEYIKELEFYISDIESYIAVRVNERLTPYTAQLNAKKLGYK